MKNYKFLSFFFFLNIVFSQVDNFKYDIVDYKTLKNKFNKSNGKQEKYKYASLYLKKGIIENDYSRIAKGYFLMYQFYDNLNSEKCYLYLDKMILSSIKIKNDTLLCVAYTEKANKLYQNKKINEAFDNFLKAEEKAKIIKSEHFLYVIKLYIGIIKSEDLGEIDEALDLYNECLVYFKKNIKGNEKIYLELLFDKADAFKAKKMTDSSSIYNLLGFKESLKYNKKMNVLFVLNEGANNLIKRKYKVALDSINKSIPILEKEQNRINLLAAYYYKALCYKALKNKSKAVENFIKVDSLRIVTDGIDPEFMEGYPYLIDYYKDKNDKNNQLKYLTIFNEIEKGFKVRYREMYKNIKDRYEIPNLIKDKDELINNLEGKKTYYNFGITILFFLLFGITGLTYYQYNLKKQYRIRFEKLMEEKLIKDINIINNKSLVQENSVKNIGISEDIIKLILEKLNQFELNNEYLESNITIQILSNQFNTNTKYLSRIINEYKKKSFVNYINELRIEFAIKQLKENKILRKYTLLALTKEFGFNSTESFTSAFYKKTAIKPMYFIKELEKEDA